VKRRPGKSSERIVESYLARYDVLRDDCLAANRVLRGRPVPLLCRPARFLVSARRGFFLVAATLADFFHRYQMTPLVPRTLRLAGHHTGGRETILRFVEMSRVAVGEPVGNARGTQLFFLPTTFPL
jgi:hypothetical protein